MTLNQNQLISVTKTAIIIILPCQKFLKTRYVYRKIAQELDSFNLNYHLYNFDKSLTYDNGEKYP